MTTTTIDPTPKGHRREPKIVTHDGRVINGATGKTVDTEAMEAACARELAQLDAEAEPEAIVAKSCCASDGRAHQAERAVCRRGTRRGRDVVSFAQDRIDRESIARVHLIADLMARGHRECRPDTADSRDSLKIWPRVGSASIAGGM
jgi:protein-disulfide isomerase-like protein with CxxC motif